MLDSGVHSSKNAQPRNIWLKQRFITIVEDNTWPNLNRGRFLLYPHEGDKDEINRSLCSCHLFFMSVLLFCETPKPYECWSTIGRYEDIEPHIRGSFIKEKMIFGPSHLKKNTPKASKGLFNAVSMETESGRRVIRTSFWLTDETPPRRREDSSIPTDVGIETATTKLRVRRRSWPTAAPEDDSPLENLVMDVLKSARRAFIRSPSLTKQSWSSGKHQSEYSCQQRDFLFGVFSRVTCLVHPLASELDLSIVFNHV